MGDRAYAEWLEFGGDFFEQITTAIYEARVQPGDRVVDVGANWGRHTVPLATCVGRRGRVVAIEALPHLAKNLGAMNGHLRQIRIVNKAVSRDEGKTEFRWVKKDEGFSGIRERPMPAGFKEDMAVIEVEKSTIDKVVGFRRWPFGRRLSFIKIDVEGGEYDVLCGARRLLTNHAPIVVFENGGPAAAKTYQYSEDDFFALFDGLSYDLFDIFARPLTRAAWKAADMPWYAIAARKGTSDAAFVRDTLPDAIERIGRTFETQPA